MARAAYVKSLLGGLPDDVKRTLTQVFDYVLDNLRLGVPDVNARSENVQAYFYEATTPAVANTEFTIAHGLDAAPYLLVPVLALEEGQQLVPLTVSRAPDAKNIYLKSSAASAPIRVLVEG